ncbi:MAG: DUF488 domain-containing protein [Succiniclasticum sp.]|uniref:DUF488 domain-containing protein n=1 Tax=Succiniclasticum sp. TaxID=2775030 RepID=UPI002A91C0C5|nr:DUF488 domain-containing protein [Succiniclasticum sp.]MDY6291558.1 DUF488 domain-containing protein [Succiniclasticum sp.]
MIYTMGFTKKSAEVFFDKIKKYKIEMLIDVRLNNKSQLAGFSKGTDLSYLLAEICKCQYSHELEFAPTKEILDKYKKKQISWEKYATAYNNLLVSRGVEKIFEEKYKNENNVLFLCSEPEPDCCHRRLLAEYIGRKLNINIVHV